MTVGSKKTDSKQTFIKEKKMELIPVRSKDRELLWNINQKYLYEMTNYYDDEMDPYGNLQYGYFDAYFTDPKRTAYFIYAESKLVGFAMINPYSYLNGKPDHVLAEFTIFPMYRRRHYAREAAKTIFNLHRGNWEVKYNERNTAAKTFWSRVTERYHPQKIHITAAETVLSFRVD